MKRNLVPIVALSFCLTVFMSCEKNSDDGSRGFLSTATIVGDSIGGYHCYLDGGGLVISHDASLAEMERGYFIFKYMESDWTVGENGIRYIDNAHVSEWVKYEVISPINKEEADLNHVTDKENRQSPSLLNLEHAYRGYFDLNGGFSTFNKMTGETLHGKLNLVYDPKESYPDTLTLTLCYASEKPETWTNTAIVYRTLSCDLSSLAALRSWSDTVIVVLQNVDDVKHWLKISKNDFVKPDVDATRP